MPGPAEGGKMELAYGEVVRMAPVGGEHGAKQSRLDRRLGAFVELHDIGEVGVEIGFVLAREPDLVRAPDISFTAKERLSAGLPVGFVDGPPTLAVEVKSPGDTEPELLRKVAEYLEAGAEPVWVVRPRERTVTVHRMDRQDERGAGEVLTSEDAAFGAAGFELSIDELFRP